jgi:hypothetical protein
LALVPIWSARTYLGLPILGAYLLNVQQNAFNKDSRAKHVLSKVEGTPRRKANIFFSELGVLCVFARVISLPIP